MKLFLKISSVTERGSEISLYEYVIKFRLFSTYLLWVFEDEHAGKTTLSLPWGIIDIYVIKRLLVYYNFVCKKKTGTNVEL